MKLCPHCGGSLPGLSGLVEPGEVRFGAAHSRAHTRQAAHPPEGAQTLSSPVAQSPEQSQQSAHEAGDAEGAPEERPVSNRCSAAERGQQACVLASAPGDDRAEGAQPEQPPPKDQPWTSNDWSNWAYFLGLRLDRFMPAFGHDNRDRLERAVQMLHDREGAQPEPEEGGNCNVCGGPVRYGERHPDCGRAVMAAERKATEPFEDRIHSLLGDLGRANQEIARLREKTTCQYGVDVGMPEHRCADQCQYAAYAEGRKDEAAEGAQPEPDLRKALQAIIDHPPGSAHRIARQALERAAEGAQTEPVVWVSRNALELVKSKPLLAVSAYLSDRKTAPFDVPLYAGALQAPSASSAPLATKVGAVGLPSADRPTSEPGGCECMECGRIFIGASWHTVCGLCAPSESQR